MRRVGCLFAGQGAQYVGMGRDLVDQFTEAAEVFRQADEMLGFKLSSLCFEGPADRLAATQYSQPAILTMSVAAAAAAWPQGRPTSENVVGAAGLSLGEYSALVFAGAVSFADALELVARRGQLMADAGRDRPGTMASVIGLQDEQVEEFCRQASSETEMVVAANFNCPGQVVVSGDPAAVARLSELARGANALKVQDLDVSGAFHSPLMEPAREELAECLEQTLFTRPWVPVVSNVTGEPVEDPEEIRQNLAKQLTSPVRWSRCCAGVLALGAESLYEVGPGKVLRGLMRRIDRNVPVTLLGTSADVETVRASGLAEQGTQR